MSVFTLTAQPARPGPDSAETVIGNANVRDFQKKVSGPKIRMIYLVPKDKKINSDYVVAMENAIKHLQVWYRGQMGNGKTFTLNSPVVEVVKTTHPASWYTTNPNGQPNMYFWDNLTGDGFALTGGRFDDPNNRWVFYIEADASCGQLFGGTSGVATLPANDLRGLAGQQNIPCGAEHPDTNGVCRWVGGLGHELGHALGLPHPPGCPGSDTGKALMCVGYITYPDAVLSAADKQILNASPFFTALDPGNTVKDCKSLMIRKR